MKRYYGHRITKRERAAIAILYDPASQQSDVPNARQPATDHTRGLYEALPFGEAENQPGDSGTRIGKPAGESTPPTAAKG